MNKSILLAAVALSFAFSTTAFAEQKPASGTTDNTTVCKAIYEIYDLNMEAYYEKKSSHKARQEAYNSAQRAISDFRKKGCKYKDVAA